VQQNEDAHAKGMSTLESTRLGIITSDAASLLAKADYLALRKARVPRVICALIGAATSAVSLAESLLISSD
jgi:hypothetical protein